MARLNRPQPSACRDRGSSGFSLIEVVIATGVLTVGVLSLVGALAFALSAVASSSAMLIAREKAREAVESVHSARDTGELAWSRVNNVSAGGSFLDGMRDIRTPGPDGLVNTADDGGLETLREPGPDGVLNTVDDVLAPLGPDRFQREIAITPLTLDGSTTINQNLRQITVRVRYWVAGGWRVYTLTTFVSSYS
jgi:hypothetical protein